MYLLLLSRRVLGRQAFLSVDLFPGRNITTTTTTTTAKWRAQTPELRHAVRTFPSPLSARRGLRSIFSFPLRKQGRSSRMNDSRTEIGEALTEHEANAVESVRLLLLLLLPPAQLEKARVVTRLLVCSKPLCRQERHSPKGDGGRVFSQ